MHFLGGGADASFAMALSIDAAVDERAGPGADERAGPGADERAGPGADERAGPRSRLRLAAGACVMQDNAFANEEHYCSYTMHLLIMRSTIARTQPTQLLCALRPTARLTLLPCITPALELTLQYAAQPRPQVLCAKCKRVTSSPPYDFAHSYRIAYPPHTHRPLT